jgi:hypothetical protein
LAVTKDLSMAKPSAASRESYSVTSRVVTMAAGKGSRKECQRAEPMAVKRVVH